MISLQTRVGVLVAAVAGAVVIGSSTFDEAGRAPQGSQVTGRESNPALQRSPGPLRQHDEATRGGAGRLEDPSSADWDAKSSDERVRTLTTSFDDAMTALRAGRGISRSLVEAESALTALRPELYRSVDGREQYARMEADLDRLSSTVVLPESRSEERVD